MKSHPLGFQLFSIVIRFEQDIVTARQKTRRISQLLGFDNQDQARLATAVSELARNIFQYARTGTLDFVFSIATPQALYVQAVDSGPGIAALKEILLGTYVSRSGMGVGLLGTKKVMDHFALESEVGRGTTVTIGKWSDKRARRLTESELDGIIEQINERQADNPFEEIQNQNRDLLNALDELRTAKEDLATLNAELNETNRGVVALYGELDEKAESLQRANEVKTSFLSNMTHEFRTPLSSVISLTRLLLARVDGDLSEEQEKQVNYIRQASEGLLELVNDLLDLAKVEAGKITINPTEFGVEEVMGSLRGMFRPIVGPHSNVLLQFDATDDNLIMKTDQNKLAQILRNLMSNAIKFTEQGSITVTAKMGPEQAVYFAVADTGLGIEAQFIETIFEDYSQVPSNLQKTVKGTGLGLPLAKKLARLLGGDIWVKSTLGQGSTFYVAIPAEYTGEQEAVLFRSAMEDEIFGKLKERNFKEEVHDRYRVLIVDDDEPSRYVLKGLLKMEIDANYMEVTDGLTALDRMRTWRPDIVFLDLSMPKLGGYETLKAMKSDEALKHLPVVINTARNLSGEEQCLLEKDSTAVLSKDRSNHERAVVELKSALKKAGIDYRKTSS